MTGAVTAVVGWALQNPPTTTGGSQIPDPHPDPSGFPGQTAIETILNVTQWLALVGSVLAVLVGAGLFAFGNASANSMVGSRGKTMVLYGLVGAAIAGGGGQLVRWAFDLA